MVALYNDLFNTDHVVPLGSLCKTRWEESQYGLVITPIIKREMTLLIHSQTSTVQPLKFGTDVLCHPTLHWVCDYLSMYGFRLIHVSKMGLRWSLILFRPYAWHVFGIKHNNSLASEICGSSINSMIFKLITLTSSLHTEYKITLKCMPHNIFYEKSTFVQVVHWLGVVRQ